ncbi:hypothetical protein JCM15765_02010 [Paradesulfitobacterium aromaticivorans]
MSPEIRTNGKVDAVTRAEDNTVWVVNGKTIAKQRPKERFTSLAHLINGELLLKKPYLTAFKQLKDSSKSILHRTDAKSTYYEVRIW